MLRLAITPLVGIGPAKFGATRSEVRAAFDAAGLAFKHERGSLDYFYSSSIQVEYEDDDTASFIGVSASPDLTLWCDGVDLFDSTAEAVFEMFASSDKSGDHSFREAGSYVFPNRILTLYDADPQYDWRRGRTRPVWGQIGAGDTRYLSGILRTRKGVLNR